MMAILSCSNMQSNTRDLTDEKTAIHAQYGCEGKIVIKISRKKVQVVYPRFGIMWIRASLSSHHLLDLFLSVQGHQHHHRNNDQRNDGSES